jgi:hypothetical protein
MLLQLYTPTVHNLKTISCLFGSDEGEEHVESHLDSVDEDQSMLGGDELEVDGVDHRPDLPGSLACREEVVLDLASDGSEGVSINQSKVSEEDSHEDRAPDDLVKGNLHGNSLSVFSWDVLVEPVVEVVSRGSVVEESKGGKSDETLHVEWSSTDEDLNKEKKTKLCQQCSSGYRNLGK